MLTLRFIVTALALGAIAAWGSETFFWSAPLGPLSLAEWLLTTLAYAACASAALSAIAMTGVGGATALFLGGALLGFLTEGVVVGTMYDAFPWQIVWTPLAWHALITGVAVLGLGRLAGHLPPLKLAAAWALVGFFGGVWAQFWPLERGSSMPGTAATLAYLAGLGIVVPMANLVLDRIGTVPKPPRMVLLVLPGLAASLWLAQFVSHPTVVRLACPVMVALTVLAMKHAGRGRTVSLGSPAAAWRHMLFMIAPVVATLVAATGWQIFDGLAVNIPIALTTGATALIWWLWLVIAALRPAARP